MRRVVVGLFLGLLAGGTASADGWRLVECKNPTTAEWEAFEKSVRTAKPGTDLYAPYPYPKTDAEIFEDFAYGYRRFYSPWNAGGDQGIVQAAWGSLVASCRTLIRELDELFQPPLVRQAAGSQRAAVRRLRETLGAGDAAHQVIRVVEWSPLYCMPERRLATSFLVRLFDRVDGAEIARGVVGEEGLLRQGSIARPDLGAAFDEPPSGHRLIPLDSAMASAEHVLGARPTRLQYVSTWGTLECSPIIPCVALKASGSSYLLKGGVLYRLDFPAQTFSFRDFANPFSREAWRARLDKLGEMVVSLGDDVMTAAVPVSH